jgi:hypothetical protein
MIGSKHPHGRCRKVELGFVEIGCLSAMTTSTSSTGQTSCIAMLAVLAGYALLFHQLRGKPVEENIHRLKLIKRSMYGRAKFDLLRMRVIHTA